LDYQLILGNSTNHLHLSCDLFPGKPNFAKAQINANSLVIKDYENKSNWTLGENKPNSNPISNPTTVVVQNYSSNNNEACDKPFSRFLRPNLSQACT